MPTGRMKIATWNINSLRIREDLVLDWVEAQQPDILCLQETKLTDQEFPEDAFGDLDYHVVYHGQTSYNGVAIVARGAPRVVAKGLPEQTEDDRRVIAADVDNVRVVNVYCPNGHAYESDKYRYKLGWYESLRSFLDQNGGPDRPLVLLGDFNIAPRDVDIYEGYGRGEQLFISRRERERFQALLDWGLTDTLVHLDDAPKQYTYWDYRGGAFDLNQGMRIDHILVTQPLLNRAQSIHVDRDIRGREQPSDHSPVILELAD